ncbi:MFS transporter [Hirschia maritima]|uniref:MFS transporter n=1 Tax=Hirschia maritima TaxID=1121961 RepID=UPI00036720EF|nr:MFS transporter [Hirschia maritima]
MRKFAILGIMFSAYFLFGILLNSVGTVILQSVASFGIQKSEASVLEGFKDLPIAIVSFFIASRIPVWGFNRSLALAFALVSLGAFVIWLWPSFSTTKVMFALTGVSFAFIKVSVYSLIGRLSQNTSEHASLMNFTEGVFMLGVLSGYWMFSFFIDSANPASYSWLNVYPVLGAIGLAMVLFSLIIKMPKEEVEPSTDKIANDFKKMLELLYLPLVLVFLISAFLYVLIEQGIGTWLPTFNNEVLHLPHAMSVQATSIFALALAAGRFGAGGLLKIINWYPLLNFCILAIVALILITMPLAKSTQANEAINWLNAPLAAYLFPLIGLFMAPIYPAINSVVLSALPGKSQSTMSGLIVVFSALGGTFGSLIIGQIFEKIGGINAFYCVVIPTLALVCSVFFLRRLNKTQVDLKSI